MSITISKKSKDLKGEIHLSGSKSISNRILMIQALCDSNFLIENLSSSDDTQTLLSLLDSKDLTLDAHHAGTTFRFMTAYLAFYTDKKRILTGSDRMKQRPIHPLVDALNSIGADIEYAEKIGYPPLIINPCKEKIDSEVTIPASISSQFITALLLMAPSLSDGLKVNLEGSLVSRPYIEMTLSIMKYFGVEHVWEENRITIAHQKYLAKDIFVEGDWSSASYYFSMAAMSDDVDLKIHGLTSDSLQGDSAISKIAEKYGVTSSIDHRTLHIKKEEPSVLDFFEYDFIKVPDIAQTVSVMCAGIGCSGLYSGLQTLKIKETDRITALKIELEKVNVFIAKLPSRFSKKQTEYYTQEGKAYASEIPSFDTYQDHRMAMAFAPLAMLFPIQINEENVVSKSYPDFWKDLEKLGYQINSIG